MKQFDELLGDFDRAYEKAMDADRSKRGCERKKGAGEKPRLASTRLKLFFVLIYLKCYLTYDVLGRLFDLDSGTIVFWIKRLLPILETTLGQKQVLPARKIRSVEEFLQLFPHEKDLLIDGTERRTQRSSHTKTQRKHYSGKQGCHTRKNIVMGNPEKDSFSKPHQGGSLSR